MTYQLQFGTYAIPSGIYVAKVGMGRRIPTSKTPRADGGRAAAGLLDLKKISLQGTLFRPLGNGTSDYLRTLLDGLKAGLAQGPADFTIDSDRKYRLCQAESYSDDFDPTSLYNYANITFDLLSADPYSYASTGSTSTHAISGTAVTVTVTAGGNAAAAPQISLTVGGSGAVSLAATLTNLTTGEVCTLIGSVTGGDVIVVDSLAQSVQISGVDQMLLFDGMFPRLAVGANALKIEEPGGNVSEMDFAWNDRWY